MALSKYLAEFIGTFFLVFTIGMTVIDPGAGNLAPLAIASALMVMVYAGGHISGAHYNPAVTVAVTVRGKASIIDFVPYVIAQLGAAAAAAYLVIYLKHGVVVKPMEFPVIWPALIVEAIFTFGLVYVVLNVATAKSTSGNSFYGLAIGFIVLAGAFAVGSISGGAFNPAVAVGAAIMGLIKFSDIWIHLTGELVGAILAAAIFRATVRDQS